MFQVLGDSVGNYVNLKTVGKITSKDYDTLIPYLEESLKEEGPLNMSVVRVFGPDFNLI